MSCRQLRVANYRPGSGDIRCSNCEHYYHWYDPWQRAGVGGHFCQANFTVIRRDKHRKCARVGPNRVCDKFARNERKT